MGPVARGARHELRGDAGHQRQAHLGVGGHRVELLENAQMVA